ncbi:CzcE family metal-binding protein [Pseudoduganella sp. FT26W]|uniref:CzcE family metal-binding protein n=1 Tax=Duganella aquatilis TaxID=2666082 RepID=A0A844D3K6_9BURK|nr:CzcE family metal-binding protein [Duganella aquatilis]MRW82726.1 CzcE family metal-binding protein [Duganella aquatilis]
MFNFTTAPQKRLLLAAIFAVSCAGAHAANNYGSTAPQTAAEKLIAVGPQTKYINVDNGETVTFVHGHEMFTWNFRTLHESDSFKLADIAPAGFDAGNVEVYVARDPLYR